MKTPQTGKIRSNSEKFRPQPGDSMRRRNIFQRLERFQKFYSRWKASLAIECAKRLECGGLPPLFRPAFRNHPLLYRFDLDTGDGFYL